MWHPAASIIGVIICREGGRCAIRGVVQSAYNTFNRAHDVVARRGAGVAVESGGTNHLRIVWGFSHVVKKAITSVPRASPIALMLNAMWEGRRLVLGLVCCRRVTRAVVERTGLARPTMMTLYASRRGASIAACTARSLF